MNEHEGRATWFAYCPHGGGFINFATEAEARDEAERLLDEQRDEAPDGWSEATDQICWGRVHGEGEELGRRERTDSDRVSPDCDEIVSYELVDIVAPIPPAEEIAAMREVCEAARNVGHALEDPGIGDTGPLEILEWIIKAQGSPEFGGDAECPFEMGELVDPYEAKRVHDARGAVDALDAALTRLDAARKGGATC